MHYPHFPSELEARSKRAWQSRKTISNIQFTVNIHLLYICSSSGLILFSFVNNNGVSLCQEKKEIRSVDRYKGKKKKKKEKFIYSVLFLRSIDFLTNAELIFRERAEVSFSVRILPLSLFLSLVYGRLRDRNWNEWTNERTRGRVLSRGLSHCQCRRIPLAIPLYPLPSPPSHRLFVCGATVHSQPLIPMEDFRSKGTCAQIGSAQWSSSLDRKERRMYTGCIPKYRAPSLHYGYLKQNLRECRWLLSAVSKFSKRVVSNFGGCEQVIRALIEFSIDFAFAKF